MNKISLLMITLSQSKHVIKKLLEFFKILIINNGNKE